MAQNYARQEIQSFTGEVSPKEEALWLAKHGMLPDDTLPYTVATDREWARLGAETFILHFSVHTPESRARFIAKACLKIPVTPSLLEWTRRREALTSNGVATPRLHASSRGSIIEEYIPYDFRAAFKQQTPDARPGLINAFLDTYQNVYATGFRPLDLNDARSRGDDVVLIDFGSDLGGQMAHTTTMSDGDIYEKAQTNLAHLLDPMYHPQ